MLHRRPGWFTAIPWEAGERLNFSEWTSLQLCRADEVARVIHEGEMPPAVYLPMHPSAQLTAAKKQQLITG